MSITIRHTYAFTYYYAFNSRKIVIIMRPSDQRLVGWMISDKPTGIQYLLDQAMHLSRITSALSPRVLSRYCFRMTCHAGVQVQMGYARAPSHTKRKSDSQKEGRTWKKITLHVTVHATLFNIARGCQLFGKVIRPRWTRRHIHTFRSVIGVY